MLLYQPADHAVLRRERGQYGRPDQESEALLFRAGQWLRFATVCQILGWSGTRLRAAVLALQHQGSGRGIECTCDPGLVGLRPKMTAATSRMIAATDRHLALAEGLRLHQAKVLYQVIKSEPLGRSKVYAIDGNAETAALGTLMNAGLVERKTWSDKPTITADVAFSLAPALAAMCSGTGQSRDSGK